MKPLIRVKSSYDPELKSAKAIYDVYNLDDCPNTTIAKGALHLTNASSAEEGELGAINGALGAISTHPAYKDIEIESDIKNIRDFVGRASNPTTHSVLRNSISGHLTDKNVTTRPLPKGYTATFTSVTAII
jgi:hypothetical protein